MTGIFFLIQAASIIRINTKNKVEVHETDFLGFPVPVTSLFIGITFLEKRIKAGYNVISVDLFNYKLENISWRQMFNLVLYWIQQKSLPLLRQSLFNRLMTIDGIRPPPQHVVGTAVVAGPSQLTQLSVTKSFPFFSHEPSHYQRYLIPLSNQNHSGLGYFQLSVFNYVF